MKTKLYYSGAYALASQVCNALSPFCECIEIAGSIRRRKKEIGDIEIVCIPHQVPVQNLFGEKTGADYPINEPIRQIASRIAKNGERYKQFFYQDMQVDLFLTTPESWGLIFAIRTGPAEFSRRLVTQRSKGGLLPSHLHVKNGSVWDGEQVIPTNTERDLFQILELDWIPPQERQ